jgi:hypothetical protein
VTAYAEYHSTEAHKLLADQREQYIAQSAATRNGRVASYPVSPARCLVAPPSRQVAGSYNDDFEQQMREGFAMKYGEASVAG